MIGVCATSELTRPAWVVVSAHGREMTTRRDLSPDECTVVRRRRDALDVSLVTERRGRSTPRHSIRTPSVAITESGAPAAIERAGVVEIGALALQLDSSQ